MEFDGLRKIELDPVAPLPERLPGQRPYDRVHDELGHMRRADQKPAKALGALAIKPALAKRRLLEPARQIRFDPADQGRRRQVA